MGLFWQGIPHSFFPAIRNALGTSITAIESGTYKGHTSRKLSHFADQVITIEADFEYFLKSEKTLKQYTNTTVLHGDSGELIGNALPPGNVGCMMWLDAHYSGGNTAGEHDYCPLINELRQILFSRNAINSIILIDDSRGLTGANGWPILSELVGLLNQNNFSSIIIDDVLIASSPNNLKFFAESLTPSRTNTFERLGGRLFWVMPLISIVGFITSLGFKVKNQKLFNR